MDGHKRYIYIDNYVYISTCPSLVKEAESVVRLYPINSPHSYPHVVIVPYQPIVYVVHVCGICVHVHNSHRQNIISHLLATPVSCFSTQNPAFLNLTYYEITRVCKYYILV